MIFLQNVMEAVELCGIVTDSLNLVELQVDDISANIRYDRKYKKIYSNLVNHTLSRRIFSENYVSGGGDINSF